jgi:hypothetical protein
VARAIALSAGEGRWGMATPKGGSAIVIAL